MKFEDLVFDKHRVMPTEGIAALAIFPNDIEVSVVAGKGLYSTPGGLSLQDENKGIVSNADEVSTFEVGIFRGDNEVEVLGWQTREDIEMIFNNVI